jgi:uncharacterized protein YbbK (DUF523 family)
MGENCRYDGRNCRNDKLINLLKGRDIKAVCPEKTGGLPIPRPPAEIVGGDGRSVLEGKAIVKNKPGEDVTREFISGGQKILSGLKNKEIELAILKSRSPSCGIEYIYDGTFSGRLKKGPGVLGALLLEKGIPVFCEENLEKIKEILK